MSTTPDPTPSAILVTGANGHLGTQLVKRLSHTRQVIAAVRSAAAAKQLTDFLSANNADLDRVDVEVISYTDVEALAALVSRCFGVVHLVGIIKESPGSTYFNAHEATTQALLDALASVNETTSAKQPIALCYLSIVGAHPESTNACLASKGRAEQSLLDSPYPSAIVQLPMVLGEGDYAAQAINQQARRSVNVVFAKHARDQPIYAGDVLSAIVALLTPNNSVTPTGTQAIPTNARLILAGPEAINKAQLLHRAAALRNRSTLVIGLPLFIARVFTKIVGRISNNPPITLPMLEILHHDDNFDTTQTSQALGLSLTSLDEMLRLVESP